MGVESEGMMDNDVYYRVIHSNSAENAAGLCVVCMQWFDEHDYDQSRFDTDTCFKSEADANAYVERQELKVLRALWKLKAL